MVMLGLRRVSSSLMYYEKAEYCSNEDINHIQYNSAFKIWVYQLFRKHLDFFKAHFTLCVKWTL